MILLQISPPFPSRVSHVRKLFIVADFIRAQNPCCLSNGAQSQTKVDTGIGDSAGCIVVECLHKKPIADATRVHTYLRQAKTVQTVCRDQRSAHCIWCLFDQSFHFFAACLHLEIVASFSRSRTKVIGTGPGRIERSCYNRKLSKSARMSRDIPSQS